MKPANLLFILSDEHNPRVLGCAGHPMIRTPNLDRLAAKGVHFSDAYCNSPICVPSRAALAAGRYVHRIRFWDNAIPYDGSVPSWHHRVREAGHEVTAIGKLRSRSAEDDNGFTREIMPLHGTIVCQPLTSGHWLGPGSLKASSPGITAICL